MDQKFLVIVTRDEAGWFTAECPSLPGCLSQGRDKNEAIENIREAIELSLETRKAEGLTTDPVPAEIEEVQIAVNG